MNSGKKFIVGIFALAMIAMVGSASAVPTIDGTASVADDYAPLSIQNTDTQFGDATNADLLASGGGSEIDQVFGKIEGGRLYMVFAGNLEINFNKLHLFIDSVPGGVNQINGDVFTPGDNNVPFGLDRFCCGGFEPPDGSNTDNEGALQRMDGMTFDAGFEADYTLIFTHGKETVGENSPIEPINFYAMSAHYADLTQGTAGNVVAAGIQLGPLGVNEVMRVQGPDFQQDIDVDGSDYLVWQRGFGTLPGEPGGVIPQNQGNANADDVVDGADLALWEAKFGSDRDADDNSFTPFAGGPLTTDLLLGTPLPGLNQGDLIDKNYALGTDGGCTAITTDGNAGCAVRELEFVLPVDTNDSGNTLNHRDFENTIDLKVAVNNGNNVGVEGDGTNGGDYTIPTIQSPGDVKTGVEFSIPLSEIGDPESLSDLKVTAFVNGSNHDFLSNQFAGIGVLQGNLGADGIGGSAGDLSGIDLSSIAGDQFVTLAVPAVSASSAVPEPAAAMLALVGVMACGLLARKRS